MKPLINLLPWRQRQRQQSAQRWGAWLMLILIIAPLLVACVRQFSAWEISQQQVNKEYLGNMLPALKNIYQKRLLEQAHNQKLLQLQQTRAQQQRAIQVWDGRLIQLADFLPPGVWLSALTLQKNQFVIKGHAGFLDDVQALKKELTQLAGVATVRTGAVQYEGQGGMDFVFTLTLSEVANALAN